MIHLYNNSSDTIQVAVSQWGNDGSTKFYEKKQGQTGEWARDDSRGFLMAIRRPSGEHRYFVMADSKVDVSDDAVVRDGRRIEPLD
ncbi:hypothetical protein DB30_00368 [Enhygromyxa salina]|uniref:Uncharacterized protein n=1 Tax=Enhygromyxa salina TaxID=215803 RepID=A0A0C1ZQP6_9BACT|nr:hypothetical protein [Enhygromyxa salina]KIG13273.1 hypothetical protein DB30_00368 [Enhygromyxa salina]